MPYAVDYYKAIGGILGQGGVDYCIFPFGDPRFENAAHTTFLTTGSGALDGLVCTYSKDRRTFDLLMPTQGRANIPRQPLDGVDEEADTPDAAALSFDDSAGEPVSIGVRVQHTSLAGIQRYISKWDSANGREWLLGIASNGIVSWIIRDESAAVSPDRTTNAVVMITQRCQSVTLTYDGSGGALAMNGATIYVDEKVAASTANNNGAYVAMEGTGTGVVSLGFENGGGGGTPQRFFSGIYYGGANGPYITNRLLTPQDIRAIGIIQLEALNDLPLINRARGLR